MKKTFIVLTVLLLGFIASSGVQATTLIIDGNNKLLGADGVNVNDSFYDVRFEDNTAQAIWGDDYHFTFNTEEQASQASLAILGSVLLPAPGYADYDLDPEMTNGISYDKIGVVLTPWYFDGYLYVEAVGAYNYDDDRHNICSYNQIWLTDENLFDKDMYVWAVWSTAASVPEPTTMLLFGLGLLGISGVSRRKKIKISSLK